MEHIKFKVWDKNREQMIKWTDLDFSKDSGEDDITVFEPTGIVKSALLMPILLQSTELLDKNGVEIYEGDIIDKGYSNMHIKDKTGYVELGKGGDSDGYIHGQWMGWITNNNDSLLDVHEHCTVLGNIYENPELYRQC